ncbi:hypothetical protein BH09PSE1_BH09PSE1_28470 [soil metagenome]
MTDQIETAPVVEAPASPQRLTVLNVCLMLLVGCCLCASLAASLI